MVEVEVDFVDVRSFRRSQLQAQDGQMAPVSMVVFGRPVVDTVTVSVVVEGSEKYCNEITKPFW